MKPHASLDIWFRTKVNELGVVIVISVFLVRQIKDIRHERAVRIIFLVKLSENIDMYSVNGSILLTPTESIIFINDMTRYRHLAIF